LSAIFFSPFSLRNLIIGMFLKSITGASTLLSY
jgi:hypothetical protein